LRKRIPERSSNLSKVEVPLRFTSPPPGSDEPVGPQTLQPGPAHHAKHMTRGKKPAAAIRDAKKFAERMGYR